MNILIGILCTFIILLMGCTVATMYMFFRSVIAIIEKFERTPEPKTAPAPTMSDEDIETFKAADAAAAESFNNVFANLNAFMTDTEVKNNVEEQ